MTIHIDISIGPVQGFVAQSRRTRDLWGSSYLLAFLSAHAMVGATEAGGKITQPVVDNDLLFLWAGGHRDGKAPDVGSLPNHFIVKAPDGIDPKTVADASAQHLDSAWQQACAAVWDEFLKPVHESGQDTKQIWKRQIEHFWEVNWTAGPSTQTAGLLARRKHWRSHRVPDEPGDKCTLMHDLQELSGFNGAIPAERENQTTFWSQIQHRIGALNLRGGERLCAVAFVKRMFPLVSQGALGWDVHQNNWPSTAHIAARPWMANVIAHAPQLAREYAAHVERNADSVLSEQLPSSNGLNLASAGFFSRLDANYLHHGYLDDDQRTPLKQSSSESTRENLRELLTAIQESPGPRGQLGPPSNFYALLLADGDRLGRLVGELGGERVGSALHNFTAAVPNVVKKHDGVAVYAGGDDVLAMLPVERVLQCAEELSAHYAGAFDNEQSATLSAAVVFAQIRQPLNLVINEAHRLLNNVAKDGNGRNSLAVSVLKPSGHYCQWVTTWTRKLPGGESASAVDLLAGLVDDLKPASCTSGESDPNLSSSVIYRIRDILTRLCGWQRWRPGEWGAFPEGLAIRTFLRAEIERSGSATVDDGAAGQLTKLVDSVWHTVGRSQAPSEQHDGSVKEAGVDALLLARFLLDPSSQEHEG